MFVQMWMLILDPSKVGSSICHKYLQQKELTFFHFKTCLVTVINPSILHAAFFGVLYHQQSNVPNVDLCNFGGNCVCVAIPQLAACTHLAYYRRRLKPRQQHPGVCMALLSRALVGEHLLDLLSSVVSFLRM